MMGTIRRRILLMCLLYSVISSCTAAFTEQEQALIGKEFDQLYEQIKSRKFAPADVAEKAEKLFKGDRTGRSTAGTTYSFSDEERIAFTDWINYQLQGDADLQSVLPISSEETALFDALNDGIILCKMINKAVPNTIDERAINKANLNTITISENQNMVLNSAASIGANVVHMGPEDLMEGKPDLVLGLLWQIIRTDLLGRISLQTNPNLAVLLEEGETLSDILSLSPESILLRWINYHLEQSGSDRRINNFEEDVKDSEAYIILLRRVAPSDAGVDTSPLGESSLEERAEKLLMQAEKFDVRKFVQPQDITKGNSILNLAFVANIFNNYPALPDPDADFLEFYFEDFTETREEKTFRNWMNSLGVDPYVNHLYTDLTDGLVLLQLFDKVQPGIVDWDKVHNKPFSDMSGNMKKLENCNYVIELAQKMKFSVVGIGGIDIKNGNKTLTLAIIWQLLRAYILSVLQKVVKSENPIEDAEIIAWTNSKLSGASKSSTISSFKDPAISTSKPVIDLIDAIKPGSIQSEFVSSGMSEEEKVVNAKYAISVARKIGARIYARPEDLVEVNHKMALTVFASLMARGKETESSSREINLIRELLLLEKLLELE